MARRDKRQEIMQAAEKLFSTRRFHEITTDEVAEAARVGKGTIYRYFADKEDLFFQTAMSGFDALCDLVRKKVPGGAPFREQLLGTCEQVGMFFTRRRQLFRMMQAEEFRLAIVRGSVYDRWVAHRRKLVAAVGDVIRKGVAKGIVRTDLPADVLANFLLGMLRTRARDLEDEPDDVRRYEVVVDLFCHGTGRRDERTPGKPVSTLKGRAPLQRRRGHAAQALRRAGR